MENGQNPKRITDSRVYHYTPLNQLKEGTTVNVYGRIKFTKEVVATRSGEFCLVLKIIDQSILDPENGLKCNIFAKTQSALPVLTQENIGEVIRFHRLTIQTFADRLQGSGNCNRKLSWVLFPRNGQTPTSSHHDFTCSNTDLRLVDELYLWTYEASRTLCCIEDLSPSIEFCDILGKVVGVQEFPSDSNCALLQVTDGTLPKYVSCHLASAPMGTGAPLFDSRNDVPPEYVLNVYVYSDHIESIRELTADDFVQIQNLHVKEITHAKFVALRLSGGVDGDDFSNHLEIAVNSGRDYNRGISKMSPTLPEVKEIEAKLASARERRSVVTERDSEQAATSTMVQATIAIANTAPEKERPVHVSPDSEDLGTAENGISYVIDSVPIPKHVGSRDGNPPSTGHKRYLEDLSPITGYCDVYAQVRGVLVFPSDKTCAVLQVTDGTAPHYASCHLIKSPLSSSKQLCQKPPFLAEKYCYNIYIFDNHVQSVEKLHTGDFVLIRNLHVKPMTYGLMAGLKAAGIVFAEDIKSYLQVIVHTGVSHSRGIFVIPSNYPEAQEIKNRLAYLKSKLPSVAQATNTGAHIESVTVEERRTTNQERLVAAEPRPGPSGVKKTAKASHTKDNLDKDVDGRSTNQNVSSVDPQKGQKQQSDMITNVIADRPSGSKQLQESSPTKQRQEGTCRVPIRIEDLHFNNSPCDLTVQVVGIFSFKADRCMMLRVSDGTTSQFPSFQFPSKYLSDGGGATEETATSSNNDLNVYVFNEHMEVVKKLQLFDMVILKQLSVHRVTKEMVNFFWRQGVEIKGNFDSHIMAIMHGGNDLGQGIEKVQAETTLQRIRVDVDVPITDSAHVRTIPRLDMNGCTSTPTTRVRATQKHFHQVEGRNVSQSKRPSATISSPPSRSLHSNITVGKIANDRQEAGTVGQNEAENIRWPSGRKRRKVSTSSNVASRNVGTVVLNEGLKSISLDKLKLCKEEGATFKCNVFVDVWSPDSIGKFVVTKCTKCETIMLDEDTVKCPDCRSVVGPILSFILHVKDETGAANIIVEGAEATRFLGGLTIDSINDRKTIKDTRKSLSYLIHQTSERSSRQEYKPAKPIEIAVRVKKAKDCSMVYKLFDTVINVNL